MLRETHVLFPLCRCASVHRLHFKTPAPVTVTESPTEAPEETLIALIPSVSESADTSSSSVKPAETETAGSLKPEQEVGEVTSIRRYVSSSDMFSEPYLPELVLNPDGTFVLTENLFEGMGHYSGTYTAEDYNLHPWCFLRRLQRVCG